MLSCENLDSPILAEQPLLTWRSLERWPFSSHPVAGGEQPQILSARKNAWTLSLGPRGLVCEICRTGRGRFGEEVFFLELANSGPAACSGVLFPPFTSWIGQAEADPRSFCMAHDHAWRGSQPVMYAWPPREMGRDVFSAIPTPASESLLTAVLARTGETNAKIGDRGGLLLEPGQRISFTLHLDHLPGTLADAMNTIWRKRGGYRLDTASYDGSRYEDPSLRWVKDIVVSWLNWAWDRDVLDPVTGAWHLEKSLERAKRRFGGCEVYMIWPFWPRAGFDGRFQFDHFDDMPGGREGLREQVRKAHALGTRLIASYCVWSESDRDPTKAFMDGSFRDLVALALDIEADGVLMDIMSATPREILDMAHARGRELTPFNEGDPGWAESQQNLVGRIHNNFPMPRFNLKKYLLPHHPLLRVCEPGNEGKVMRNDIGLSFFQGHGVEINTMFPQENPACAPDWDLLARAADILRINRASFQSTEWEPFVESLSPHVWINRWPTVDTTLYTLCCTTPSGHHGAVLRIPRRAQIHYVDMWRHRPIEPLVEGDDDLLACDIEGFQPNMGMERGTGDYSFGCIGAFTRRLRVSLDFEQLLIAIEGAPDGGSIEIRVGDVKPSEEPIKVSVSAENANGIGPIVVDLWKELGRHTNEAIIVRLLDRSRQLVDEDIVPAALVRFFRVDRATRTERPATGVSPDGMEGIKGGSFRYVVRATQTAWQATYSNRGRVPLPIPDYERDVVVPDIWMDRYPVTNDQFAQFLKATRYRPAHTEAFLRHFINGSPPEGQGNHPAVFVSHDDARAYAAWAGKRLPTEEEWAYAAQPQGEGVWPWGATDPAAELCALGGAGTQPVDAHPQGASRFGVEDLVGNVWQWTADAIDNGRHRTVYLRGGGWYQPPQGIWWVHGGPRPITDHVPLPLFGPGMNRLSTVGFRCVMDG
jgi:gamma-glutamyl hercynylcysteine S-oxide synthase